MPLDGQPWWKTHPLTGRIEFANLVIGFDSSSSKSWAQFRQTRAMSPTGGSGGSGDDSKMGTPLDDKEKEQVDEQEKGH